VNVERMASLFFELGVEVPLDRPVTLACPFHDDGTPSLRIDPSATGGWYCHGCHRGGGVVAIRDLVARLTDDELEAVSKRTGTPTTKLLALRERLRGGKRQGG
jgi:hypothetical protein